MFKTSGLYEANYNATESIIINQGGTSSGKTYSILQVLFTIACSQDNQLITVVGQDIPNLKAGALRDSFEIVRSSRVLNACIASYNKTDRVYTFNSGSKIEFKSYSDFQDAKSGKRNYLFINEANGVPYEIFYELWIRTNKQTFIDYNPNSEFWVHEKLIGQKDVKLLISDHRHNPFVMSSIREKIEGLKEKDLELWKVYARGLTGKIEGLVFRDWIIVDEIPKDAKYLGSGLDFGFTNDPTAIVDVFIQNGELWIDEIVYQSGLTNPEIATILGKNRNVIADSAEPKSIREISLMGCKAQAAEKGPGSISSSIDILKRYKMNITRRSVNLKKELSSYKWAVDSSGKHLNEPVDFMNHAIDALRYFALNNLKTTRKGSIKSYVV